MISDKKLNLYVLLGLILFAVAIRFPWFYLDTINWDESVYILVGQSLADGHLPYTQIWENKPPLAFVFYAICEYLVPNSLAFIRFSGAVLIGVTGWIIFLISNKITYRSASILAGLLAVASATFFIPFAQCILLEHIAIAPIMLALFLLCKANTYSPLKALITGALFGIAILIRSNLIIVPILLTPFLAMEIRSSRALSLKFIALSCIGALSILLLIFLPYLASNQLNVLLLTLYKVPLAYVSGVNDSFLMVITDLIRNIFIEHEDLGSARKLIYILRFFFWATGFLGLIAIGFTAFKRHNYVLKIIFMANISLLLSIIAGKHAFEHYLLQIAPIFCLNIIYIFKLLRVRAVIIKIFIFILLSSNFYISIILPSKSYLSIIKSYAKNESPYYGYSFHISEYINKNSKRGDTLFLTHYAITYWLTKNIPILPTVILPFGMLDDNAMVKAYYGNGYDTNYIFREIMNKNPTRIVIIRSQLSFQQGFYPKLKLYLEKNYKIEYSPDETPGTFIIYVKK